MPFKARSNDQNKVIVVGIAKTLDDAALSDMFGLYGTVAEAKVVKNDKGESRGFGFVTYAGAAAKNKAIKHMHQSTVDGRVLTVRDVIPKADREPEAAKTDKPKTGVCWAFQKGLCEKGDACKYPHEVKDGEYGSCFEFAQQGKCKRGDACKFLHGPKEKEADKFASDDEDEKDDAPEKQVVKTEVDPTKPRVCFAFQNGKCHRGKSCMFLHERLPTEVATTDTKKRKRDELTPQEELEVLFQAEDDALLKYEQAKSARMAKEAEIASSSGGAKTTKDAAKPIKKDAPAKKETPAKKDAPAKKEAIVKKVVKKEVAVKKEAPKAKAIVTKVPVTAPIDMGAAFDSSDDEKPAAKKAKKTTDGKPRLLASDHRKLRQEKKKAALALLKSKKEIAVTHE
ncbi:hypothetical protein SPRG_09872 [Saprolegnia parasitica CBS 223.65]|uniref:Uncharacterized protein n=1 Tax=Saprolegnia parasitica (strain CBS 223.65) TaxID=695850 RepID=A0A067CCI8_SAPPC|nr:hypothetical protein SPRG_09872 [Saprolegnia parasitica CBS 223.65]KDO24236.1 hypothetical protein SPRG_09872 [Saprolegnia parasitica CBS 223.65]|eukprot:XP_012205012.1 hypothetical protein SPRG_09872 [Saprolegnia parasitica CBS 223.65]